MSEQTKKSGKPFNPSLGNAFENSSFGEGSVLLNITTDNFDTLMKNVQIGSSLLIRYNKVTTKGNKHYFVEILPPMAPREAGKAKAATTTGDLG